MIQKGLQALGKTQYRAAIAELPEEPILARRFAASAPRAVLSRGFLTSSKTCSTRRAPPPGPGIVVSSRGASGADKEDSAIVTAFGQAGAVLAGKTQLHEFAYGLTGENPHFGDCEHPLCFRVGTTGGSSSEIGRGGRLEGSRPCRSAPTPGAPSGSPPLSADSTAFG